MDRITKSYLTQFAKSCGFEQCTDKSVLFEHFVNYTVIEPKSEYGFEIENVNIGTNGTIGIDGFALLLNGQIIETIDELDSFLEGHKKCSAEIIFIQSKTSKKFSRTELRGFGDAVTDFISEIQKLSWTETASQKIELFDTLISRVAELESNPTCHLYYASAGRDENDTNIEAAKQLIKADIDGQNIFSSTAITLLGAIELQAAYKRIGQAISRTFEFPKRVPLPEIEDVKEAYIGVVNAEAIVHLMTDEENDLISNVFYDNVRDYQGENKVNAEISETIKSDRKDSFSVLNNGITVVAEDLVAQRDKFTISNYQIINGCQTSHVLFSNKENLDDTVQVPLKLIISDNADLTSAVIRSTNRQTEVKEQDLIAFSEFQKRLEDYYGTFSGDDRLYYERRSKQYNRSPVERKRIIDKTQQIKAVASFYYDKPELATRFFGSVFAELGDKLFKNNHDMKPYYTASYALFKIDHLFRTKQIDKKYRKIKYHLITMLRHEISNANCPPFSSKRCVTYCNEALDILKSESRLLALVGAVLNKVDSLEYDLDDNEVSKSKIFVKQCLEKYG